jgi:hypothetical protein
MLAIQREAEAELGDVTARSETPTPTVSAGGQRVPNLLKATASAGNSDLLVGSSGDAKAAQLDALLAKASQYSAFIRASQDSAVDAFYMHAKDQMTSSSEGPDIGGKRKKGSGSDTSKKAKAEETSFEDAASKMAASKKSQADLKMWQPSALKGTLKDYQLDGYVVSYLHVSIVSTINNLTLVFPALVFQSSLDGHFV